MFLPLFFSNNDSARYIQEMCQRTGQEKITRKEGCAMFDVRGIERSDECENKKKDESRRFVPIVDFTSSKCSVDSSKSIESKKTDVENAGRRNFTSVLSNVPNANRNGIRVTKHNGKFYVDGVGCWVYRNNRYYNYKLAQNSRISKTADMMSASDGVVMRINRNSIRELKSDVECFFEKSDIHFEFFIRSYKKMLRRLIVVAKSKGAELFSRLKSQFLEQSEDCSEISDARRSCVAKHVDATMSNCSSLKKFITLKISKTQNETWIEKTVCTLLVSILDVVFGVENDVAKYVHETCNTDCKIKPTSRNLDGSKEPTRDAPSSAYESVMSLFDFKYANTSAVSKCDAVWIPNVLFNECAQTSSGRYEHAMLSSSSKKRKFDVFCRSCDDAKTTTGAFENVRSECKRKNRDESCRLHDVNDISFSCFEAVIDDGRMSTDEEYDDLIFLESVLNKFKSDTKSSVVKFKILKRLLKKLGRNYDFESFYDSIIKFVVKSRYDREFFRSQRVAQCADAVLSKHARINFKTANYDRLDTKCMLYRQFCILIHS
jgi:hypothetical protein